MKNKIITIALFVMFITTATAQENQSIQLWGNVKLNSSTPGMIGGGLWSNNPSLTGTVGLNIGNFSVSIFRTNDLLDKSTNGNQTDISISYGKKFGDWKFVVANDLLLFDNNKMNMLIPRVIGTYGKGNWNVEGLASYCPVLKGGTMTIFRISPSVNVKGYTFRMFIWEKCVNDVWSTPVAVQVSKKLFQFENGCSLSADLSYHLKDVSAKELESFGWCNIQVNF